MPQQQRRSSVETAGGFIRPSPRKNELMGLRDLGNFVGGMERHEQVPPLPLPLARVLPLYLLRSLSLASAQPLAPIPVLSLIHLSNQTELKFIFQFANHAWALALKVVEQEKEPLLAFVAQFRPAQSQCGQSSDLR